MSKSSFSKQNNIFSETSATANDLFLDLLFYSQWHSDLTGFDNDKLIEHWENFGKNEKRCPNFKHWIKSKGFDVNLLPASITPENYSELNPQFSSITFWEACATILLQNPVSLYRISFSDKFNLKFYCKLALHYKKHGDFNKYKNLITIAKYFNKKTNDLSKSISSKTKESLQNIQNIDSSIGNERSIMTNTFPAKVISSENFEGEIAIESNVGELDVNFYREWYLDLSSFDAHALAEHWYTQGVHEKRFPNFESLLKSRNFSIYDVPADFDPDDYMLINPSLSKINIPNRYASILHYLESGAKGKIVYFFDSFFYCTYYKDLRILLENPNQAKSHFKLYGYKENRYPNFEACIASRGFSMSLIPDTLTHDNYSYFNPLLSHLDFYRAVLVILEQEPAYPYKVSENKLISYRFYEDLGLFYETRNNDIKAKAVYLVSTFFHISPVALESMGNIELRKDDTSSALVCYTTATSFESHSPWPYRHCISIFKKLNDYPRAVDMMSNYVKMFPGRLDVISELENFIEEYWNIFFISLKLLCSTNNRRDALNNANQTVNHMFKLYSEATICGKNVPVKRTINKNNILIVGDYHIPQCVRYRIDQKVEQLKLAGYSVKTISWTDAKQLKSILFFYDIVLFYRVPAFPQIVELLAQSKALGKITIYEVDDLIFEPSAYPPDIDTYGGNVSREVYCDLLISMVTSRCAASLCDYGIVSTQPLSEFLEKIVCKKKCFIHNNALDHINEACTPIERNFGADQISIFYGSGTLAHNSDFIAEALPAIEKILSQFSHVIFVVTGHLTLPESFVRRFKNQIKLSNGKMGLTTYYYALSFSDINLAVLSSDDFNDCKSEIKWLEAGFFGIPSVVSHTKTYETVIHNMVDGIIAKSPDDFYDALSSLIIDSNLRHKIGFEAQQRIKNEYNSSLMSKRFSCIIDEIVEIHKSF